MTNNTTNSKIKKQYLAEQESAKKQFEKQKLCVRKGKVWEKATLHLKSAIYKYNHRNIVTQIELDLLKEMV